MGCCPPAAPRRGIDLMDCKKMKFPNRRYKLVGIERSDEHRLTLLDWKAQLAACRDNLNRKLSILNSSTAHLYQILGFFFVFEGVIITALSKASAIKCHRAWLIYILSLIASISTLCACVQKLREIMEGKRSYQEERAVFFALDGSIENLKRQGRSFRFDDVENQPHLQPEQPVQVRGFWKRWMWSYAGAVFFVLFSFSGVTIAAIRLILCD